MSATNNFETNLLKHIFNNDPVANVGDATGLRGSTTAGSIFVALFTSDPGETAAGIETTYTNYQRVAVARTSGAWTVSGNSVSNAAAISFPACGASGQTLTHFAVYGITGGVSADMLFSGALTSQLIVSNGVTPEFAIGQLTITAD